MNAQNTFHSSKRNAHKIKPTHPGMYLKLFHGRTPCDLQMDDWGEDDRGLVQSSGYTSPTKHLSELVF